MMGEIEMEIDPTYNLRVTQLLDIIGGFANINIGEANELIVTLQGNFPYNPVVCQVTRVLKQLIELKSEKLQEELSIVNDKKEEVPLTFLLRDVVITDDMLPPVEKPHKITLIDTAAYLKNTYPRSAALNFVGELLELVLKKTDELYSRKLISSASGINYDISPTNTLATCASTYQDNSVNCISNIGVTNVQLSLALKNAMKTNKLVLVDPNVRQVGKTTEIVLLADRLNVPIVTSSRNIDYIREHILPKLDIDDDRIELFTTANDMANKTKRNPFNGYVVDEGVQLSDIKCNVADIKLLTGFFTNYYF